MQNQLQSHSRNNLDFLRLLFAMAVVFSHSYPLTSGSDSGEPLFRLTAGIFSIGSVSVAFFFITSGYLICASWTRNPKVSDFLGRRCLRILPGFFVASAVTIAVVAAVGMPPTFHHWRRVFSQVLALDSIVDPAIFARNAFPGVPNGSLWTIRFEFWCYLILMLLGLVGVLKRRWMLLIVFAASCMAGCAFRHFGRLNFYFRGIGDSGSWAIFLPYFLAGSVTFQWRHSIPLRFGIFLTSIAVAVGATAALKNQSCFVFPISAVCGAYAMLYIAFNDRLPLQNFGRFGDFSYGTYLYAFLIQQLIVLKIPAIGPHLLFMLSAPLSLAAGVLSWFLIERHFLRGKSGPSLHPNLPG